MSNKLSQIFATFFYLGYFPLAPGTMASLAGVCLYFLFYHNVAILILVFLLVVMVGFLSGGQMEKLLTSKDPGCVVIDEVAGAMIAFFMLPMTPAVIMTAFFLFRAFDMFKVYPIYKFENYSGSVGIMMDDIIAGFYTNLIMQLALKLKALLNA